MFRWLIGSSIEFRFVVLGAALALLIFGGLRTASLPVDTFPEFDAPTVEIQTEALGLSAEEVESLITLNLEELLSGVPWLESVRSQSVTGLSSIVLRFRRGTDFIRARQMVQERLALAIYLPNVAQPPTMLQPTSSTNRLMMVGLSSDAVEETELSMLARWTIKPKLTGVPGVANVSIWGQRLKQMQVQVDPRRLRDARVTQDDILTTAGDALWVSPLTFLRGSTPGTGGWIDNRNQRLGVLHRMPIELPEDMAKVPVAPQHLLLKGKKMALGEVAEVSFGHPPLIGDAYVNGANGLMLVVEKFPDANTLEVTAAVEGVLRELERGLPGVQLDPGIFRMATYIEEAADNIVEAIIAGALLALLALGAFLFNWRAMLVCAVTVPLSLLAGLLVAQWSGGTLNVMVAAGLLLALGIVLDDAIVGMDRLVGRLREQAHEPGDEASLARLVLESARRARATGVYGALIVLLAVTPVFFMSGTAGAFFGPMTVAYVLTVLASLLVGLTVAPALSLLLFKGAAGAAGDSPVAVAVGRAYAALLRRIAGAPRAVAGGAILAVLLGLAAWPLLGQSLLPTFKEREVLVSLETAPGTSHQETYRIAARLAQELRALPDVRDVGAHVGRAITGDQIVGVNAGQIWVGFDAHADYERALAEVREVVAGYPGIDRNVQSYLRTTINEALTGEPSALVVRIYGQRREVLADKAEEVRAALADVDGLVELRAVGQVEEPQIKVRVDLDRASAVNVKPGEVRRSAATIFSGLTVGFLYEAQKIYDVVVWGAPEVRQSIDDLRNVLVEKSDRHHVRLGEVADVTVESVPTVIRHDGIAPYVDVVANVAGRDLATVHRDVRARLETVTFPLEYYPQVLGEYAERLAAERQILGLGIAAAIGIFLLLQACLRSWRLACIGFLALPAGLAGAVVAVLVSGGTVTLGSLVGLLAVIGIAARSGILQIALYQQIEAERGLPFGHELVVRGAHERLPALLASAAATVAAMLPIVVFGSIAGLEILQPAAIAIIGGVVASALFALLVLPPLYLVFGRGADRQAEIAGLADEGV